MSILRKITEKILKGELITAAEANEIYFYPPDELCEHANLIRQHFCADKFDICTIINGKSGRCTEDCKFCAQAARYCTNADEYSLLDEETIVEHARLNYSQGIMRCSIVTAGKRLSDKEIDKMCSVIHRIKTEIGFPICVSFGLLNEEQYTKLKEAGVSRVHNNLETSRNYFSNICTTHTFDDKIKSIRAAQAVGLTVCSGGIMGLGESPKDRIDMAFTLKELGIKSVPVNMLNPIQGTPFEHNRRLTNDDMRRITAIYRFILPDAHIRLAGGRGLLPDKGMSCFISGANAAITGDMLTTAGISVQTDIELLEQLGYEVGNG